MSSPVTEDTSSDLVSEANEVMLAYGIARVPVDYFHYREYRYTRLTDAIAQAKRDKKRLGGTRTFT